MQSILNAEHKCWEYAMSSEGTPAKLKTILNN